MENKQMFINGKWVDAASGAIREIINPFDQSTVAAVAEGDRADAIDAIKAARTAFDSGPWATLSGLERSGLLYALAREIESDRENLAYLETINTGKTLEESRWDMDDIAGIFKYYAGLADKDGGEIIDSPIPDSTSQVIREPIGVCGQISPWNYPLLQAAWKMAPALAAGCTIVMKPSEITPLTSIRVVELAEKVGFPDGVINLVMGPGASVGAELSENHDVDLISFTGGIETGKTIMRAASGNVKKVALELGGKNPNIIFEDADLDLVVDHAMNGVFFHAGQICSAGTRIMVAESIADEFTTALIDKVKQIKVGNGMDDGTQMGPVISAEHRRKVASYVDIAIQEGAILRCGGCRPEDPALQKGFFYEPTVFSGCTSEMRIVQEEVFGPVITIETFQTEEELVREANATIYGLSAGFWTKDSSRMHRVSRALKFGTVWINDFNVYFTQAPWGGYKQSGFGRELGKIGYEEYTEVKHVFQNHNPAPLGWFGNN